jgi:hypothetical protein
LYADLDNAVPDEHKKFLANLVWVHEEVLLTFFASCFYTHIKQSLFSQPLSIKLTILKAFWIMFYQEDVFINTDDGVNGCKLVAVHAGLEKGQDVKEQMKNLKARDTRSPKVQALGGRKNVWDIPEVSDNLLLIFFHITATYLIL